jgi:hypothetical protein
MQAWLARPSTGGALSASLSASPASPERASFLARAWILTAKAAPRDVSAMGITARTGQPPTESTMEPPMEPTMRSPMESRMRSRMQSNWPLGRLPSELEVPSAGCSPGAVVTVAARSWQQAGKSSQALPRRLVQRRIRADQIANHVPCRDVQSAFGRRAHGEGNRALGTEAYPLGRRFLPRPDAHGLGKHIDGNRFVPRLELAITTKTI